MSALRGMKFISGLSIRTKVVLLAGIPVLGTLVLAAVIAQRAQTQTAAAAALGSIEDVAQLSVRISSVMHALQFERARSALSEGYGQQAGGAATRAALLQQCKGAPHCKHPLAPQPPRRRRQRSPACSADKRTYRP
jgi:hypothetical protein